MKLGYEAIEWHGDECRAFVRIIALRRIQAASMWFTKEIKVRLSTPVRTYENGRLRFKRSKPGEYLHKDKGHLRRNIAYEVDNDGLTARIGTNVPYGLSWQVANATIARPWMSMALKECLNGIKNIIERGGADRFKVTSTNTMGRMVVKGLK